MTKTIFCAATIYIYMSVVGGISLLHVKDREKNSLLQEERVNNGRCFPLWNSGNTRNEADRIT